MIVSSVTNAAYNAATATVNAVKNNPKTTAAVVLTAATGAAAYYNAGAIAAFATTQLTNLADYSPVVREYAEYLNLLAPIPVVEEVVVEPTTLEAAVNYVSSFFASSANVTVPVNVTV